MFFLSTSKTISNPSISPVGNTPYQKPHNTRIICTMPLQSIVEVGSHSRQYFLVRLTNQFDAFFNPKNALETKASNKKQMFEENIDNSNQQELLSCCFCDHASPNPKCAVATAVLPACPFSTCVTPGVSL